MCNLCNVPLEPHEAATDPQLSKEEDLDAGIPLTAKAVTRRKRPGENLVAHSISMRSTMSNCSKVEHNSEPPFSTEPKLDLIQCIS
eukprot:783478-Amphidinium_carterae.1